jgi:hypothetical protein
MATEYGLWRYPMKNLMVLTLLLTIIFLGAVGAEAANHYVRAGASGSANGNDWTNAYTTLPSTLTRGDTYYIADGTYAGRTFNTATNGTTLITMARARGGTILLATDKLFLASLHFPHPTGSSTDR